MAQRKRPSLVIPSRFTDPRTIYAVAFLLGDMGKHMARFAHLLNIALGELQHGRSPDTDMLDAVDLNSLDNMLALAGEFSAIAERVYTSSGAVQRVFGPRDIRDTEPAPPPVDGNGD